MSELRKGVLLDEAYMKRARHRQEMDARFRHMERMQRHYDKERGLTEKPGVPTDARSRFLRNEIDLAEFERLIEQELAA